MSAAVHFTSLWLSQSFSFNGWSPVTIIVLILFSGLQCPDAAAPSNSVNFICYISLRFCSYSCQTNKSLFKNTFGYVSCDRDTLQWEEMPDCVGKQLLLLLLLLFVSSFTKPVIKLNTVSNLLPEYYFPLTSGRETSDSGKIRFEI